jgi:hydroxymethylbilane synthase
MHVPLRIGTRGSQLALWQARAVARALEAHGMDAELVIIRTSGDRLQDAPLADVGGKRLFVKEIEEALLADEIDLAVHSAKDLPAVLPGGLTVAATLHREDPRDVFVLREGLAARDLAAVAGILPAAPRIGTGSVRRAAQLAAVLPGAAFAPIRGNVDTRLRKLHEGDYDALVLAAAGLRRLGLGDRIATAIPPDVCVPAPGQGIVAIETRTADRAVREAVAAVHDADAAAALAAERAVVEALGGGCQLPLGALATRPNHDLDLRATVCSLDGTRVVRTRRQGPASDPGALGRKVADELRAGGADAILDEVRAGQGPVEGSY